MRVIARLGVTLAALAAVALAPAAARADVPAAPNARFGWHARECAQSMGFSGTHNPGMHQGRTGWDGMPCAS